jgi:hypothetical protein
MGGRTYLWKVLILSSDPWQQGKLRLGEEVRELDAGLRAAKHHEHFQLEPRWAVRPRDLRQAMLDVRPNIIHFCGTTGGATSRLSQALGPDRELDSPTKSAAQEGVSHSAPRGLVLEDDNGHACVAPSRAMAELFGLFEGDLKCVVLNACYIEEQADVIAGRVPYVIGISHAVEGKAATEFAVDFYNALGEGNSIEEAYRIGRSAVALWDVPELTLVLKRGLGSGHGSFSPTCGP